jgi:hypothetical protein
MATSILADLNPPSLVFYLARKHIAPAPRLNPCIPFGNIKNVRPSLLQCRARVTDCDDYASSRNASSDQTGVVQVCCC